MIATAEDRAETARTLLVEAGTLLRQSGLHALLTERFGKVKITGSAGYDLMVRRDIDIYMPVEAGRWAEWAYLASEIARQFQDVGLVLHKANFINDYVDPHALGAGLYWGIEFRDFAGNPWTCDLWGWDPFDFEIRDSRDANLRLDLANADRDLILRLKHEARALPDDHGRTITSFDIYQFAIAGAGETLEDLEAWKAARG